MWDIDIVDVGYMNMRDISVVGMWENRYSECGIIDIVDVGYIDMRDTSVVDMWDVLICLDKLDICYVGHRNCACGMC